MNKQKSSRSSICLFFTYGISLKKWDELGLLDREVILYKKLASQGMDVAFFTYGGKEDLNYSMNLQGIKIIPAYENLKKPNNKKLAFLQSFWLPFKFRETFARYNIYKTNQMFGAWVPLVAKWLSRKYFIVRCGYEHYFTLTTENRSLFEKVFFYLFSSVTYLFSDHIVVTSGWIADYISKKFFVSKKKISVLPNLVDVELFNSSSYPSSSAENYRVLFIGRLNREKNIFNLIEACKAAGVGLDLIGRGDMKNELVDFSEKKHADVRFLGVIPNKDLPPIIVQYPIFILPSFYEGNPKVLLEAMSCGRAIIGTEVNGIRDVIKNNETGILCGTSVGQIAEAILLLKENLGLRNKLGENARRYILENHSVDKLIPQELHLYNSMLK